MIRRSPRVLLCADDYGISAGVSRGILELARGARISAFSALVTLPRWKMDGEMVAIVRPGISIGLHVNLTLGRPLTRLPRIAPEGQFPSVGALAAAAAMRRIERGEIEAEVVAQLQAFRDVTGAWPDHVDGHQHVHALPVVRDAFLQALRVCGNHRPLVRDPADRIRRIVRRGQSVRKALGIATLAAGFGAAARRQGFPTNQGFSGFSAFDARRPYGEELSEALKVPGPRQLVMCHPGYPDRELAALDPVVERREQERAALAGGAIPIDRLWPIIRQGGDGAVDWSQWSSGDQGGA